MKKAMMFLMAMGALDTVSANNSGQDLIVNGNFADNSCQNDYCIYNTESTFKGWIPDPQIQVGYGSLYNQYLGRERVLELAPRTNSCAKQVVRNLEPAIYRLIFEYASRSDRLSEDCQFEVSFNGKLLKKITPQGDKIQTETIDIEVNSSCEGTVQFCGVGQDNWFGAILKSVKLYRESALGTLPKTIPISSPQVAIPDPGKNFILNGKFIQNSCSSDYCIYNDPVYNGVKSWLPEPEIQIGWGSIYNSNLPQERVLDLTPNQNGCVKQIIRDLVPGIYQLTYEYARSFVSVADCQFQVRFNDKVLRKVEPTNDPKPQTQTLEFQVKSGTQGELRFCSVGVNFYSGAVLKSVSMIRKNDKVLQNSTGFILDSHSGKCLQKKYQFQGGPVDITFNYQIYSNTIIQKSAVYVIVDDNPVFKISPSQNGKNFRIQGEIASGTHLIGFCTLGFPSQAVHQVSISNLMISEKSKCVPTWSKDLIFNGGFEKNSCPQGNNWCIWNQQNIGDSVPGWMPSPQIEIGKSYYYNDEAWAKIGNNSWTTELDADTNTCIKQKVWGLRKGSHVLKFDWASNYGTYFESNGAEVKVNGKLVKSLVTNDYDIHRETVLFTLESDPTDPWLEFCGTGWGDTHGISIDNVQLFSSSNC